MEYKVFKACESGFELVSISDKMPKIKDGIRVEVFDSNTGTTIIITE